MKNKLYVIFISAAVLFASAVIHAQEVGKSQTSVRFKDGLTVVFTSETEPPDSTRKPVGSILIKGDNKIIHRVFVDEELGVYFGYDVLVEPIAETGQFKLVFQPLSSQPINILQPNPPRRPARVGNDGRVIPPDDSGRRIIKLSALSLPKYPDVQTVRDGDTIAFDVLVNSKTGVKIVDLIKVIISDAQPLTVSGQTAGASGGGNRPAKDFSADEVEFKVASSKMIINGEVVNNNPAESRLGVTGTLIWFYIPRHGRFILSLTPREGYDFQKTGTVQGSIISFSMNGNQYEWISNSPIISGQNDNWNLYVLHQPDFAPAFAPAKSDSYFVGTADRIEYLIKKK